MANYHVKNEGFLAKAFKVKGGHMVVPPGKSADIADAKDLTEAQIEAFARDKVRVTKEGTAKAEQGTDAEPKTAAEVLAMANAEGVQFMTFKSEASKLLGDKTPAKKDDIIKVLEELATKPD